MRLQVMRNFKILSYMFKNAALQQAWEQLPDGPGVYLFKSSSGEILYVGKASNLKKRVASYARPKADDWKTQALVAHADSLEFRVLTTPLDALLFEAQLIQAHQPSYNILLKGGAPFIYFLFTNGKIPEMQLVRDKNRPGTYVGPFLQRQQARQIYDFLIHTFALRLCHKKIAGGCMYLHIGACAGICRNDFDLYSYKQRLNHVKKMLQQGTQALIDELEVRINAANKALEFESSRVLNRQLEQIKMAGQMLDQAGISKSNAKAGAPPQDSQHIWLLWPENQALQLFNAQRGMVKELELWFSPDTNLTDELAQNYMQQYYLESICPNSIFSNFAIDQKTVVESFLSQWHHKTQPVAIIDRIGNTPPDIVILAQTMARQAAIAMQQTPLLLAQLVGSPKPVHRIDCFDISHKQGHFMVGACVRFVDGQPDKNSFRRFHIKTVSGQDDYASLREVVSRRYEGDPESLPDLILIDGGKGQRNAVSHLVGTTPLAAIAKKEERLFCAKNLHTGVKLDPHQAHGALLIALRDYTHHFAISFHRKLAGKINAE
jgi:excinuclease ABC subunit C